MITFCIPTTKDRQGRMRELLRSIEETCEEGTYRVLIYQNNDGGWVPAIHNALDGVEGLVWLLGTDCIVEQGALKALIEAHREGLILEPYNELHGDTLCQHPFGHSSLIKKYLDKRFIHWYSDNFMTLNAQKDGILRYVPEAKIQHNHFVNGKAEMDETYKTIFDPETVKRDRLLFEKLTNE